MGYTHYFEYNSVGKKHPHKDDGSTNPYLPDDGRWEALIEFAKFAIRDRRGKASETAGAYYDDEVVDVAWKRGPDWFMVDSNEGSGETFYFTRWGSEDAMDLFVKTNRLPYDILVVAIIHAALEVRLLHKFHSDGTPQELRQGIELYYRLCDDFRKKHSRDWWDTDHLKPE